MTQLQLFLPLFYPTMPPMSAVTFKLISSIKPCYDLLFLLRKCCWYDWLVEALPSIKVRDLYQKRTLAHVLAETSLPQESFSGPQTSLTTTCPQLQELPQTPSFLIYHCWSVLMSPTVPWERSSVMSLTTVSVMPGSQWAVCVCVLNVK